MNPYTGHLIALDDNEKPPEAYEALPAELLSAARQELAGRTERKILRVEISFPVPVDLPDGWERALDGLVGLVCEQYKRENPTRVMWPAGAGSKPLWSQADAMFLGIDPSRDAPASGEPSFDDSVFVIDVSECEDYGGSNQHNPDRERLRAEVSAERKAARAKRPRAMGVSRMADNSKAVLVSFSSEPTDDDLRALHEGLR